jgi:hypothetical protein
MQNKNLEISNRELAKQKARYPEVLNRLLCLGGLTDE